MRHTSSKQDSPLERAWHAPVRTGAPLARARAESSSAASARLGVPPAARVPTCRASGAGARGRCAALLGWLLAVTVLPACSTGGPLVHQGGDDRFQATAPPSPVAPQLNNGAIYQPVSALGLFADYKAGRVGDVLTVMLVERTDASKSANASTSRDASVQMPSPTIAGGSVTRRGVPILEQRIDASRSFEGQGDAAQSNRLEGSITVTVADVLPNGNLLVQGEKWMRINQGEEYIRLRGIVRPVDIGADNTVLSTQVADAELAYGGTGPLARSNSPGWLSRFFNSVVWPF